jgi:AcrR family transcriptional regulator
MVHSTNPISDRRQRKREARKANFVELAYRIVEKEGLDRLTMPKLAQAADVAVGGLYRYFECKEALIAALQIRAAGDFVTFVDGRLSRSSGSSPLDSVRCIVDSWPAYSVEEPRQHQLLDASLSSPEVLLSDSDALAVAQSVEPLFKRFVEYLERAVEVGELKPGNALLRTHALWAAAHGVGHFQKRDRIVPEELYADRVRLELINTLLRGWGAALDHG